MENIIEEEDMEDGFLGFFRKNDSLPCYSEDKISVNFAKNKKR